MHHSLLIKKKDIQDQPAFQTQYTEHPTNCAPEYTEMQSNISKTCLQILSASY